MGRETKLLLGLLALLAGVFMGLLSMKLLVPRPPAGTGPDIHADVAVASEPHDLVEPPGLDPAAAVPRSDLPPPGDDRYAGRATGLRSPIAGNAADPAAPPMHAPPADDPVRRDPFVTTASHEVPAGPVAAAPTARPPEPASFEAAPIHAPPPAGLATAATTGRADASYVAREGDSWWSLAERAYGDGRLYRALFAWNRVLDPRVSLVPGTSIEIPALERLQAAWPTLLPHTAIQGSARP
jgi:5'-nucleotidase / UDP-sugar diphosphatase